MPLCVVVNLHKAIFQLTYLESGEYDVILAAYDYNSQGKAAFQGTLEIGGLIKWNGIIIAVRKKNYASLNFINNISK